jgi:hypothetical protein
MNLFIDMAESRTAARYAVFLLVLLILGCAGFFIWLVFSPRVIPALQPVRLLIGLPILYAWIGVAIHGVRRGKFGSMVALEKFFLMALCCYACFLQTSFAVFFVIFAMAPCDSLPPNQVVCSGFLSRDSLWEIQPNGIFMDHLGEYHPPTRTLAPKIRP